MSNLVVYVDPSYTLGEGRDTFYRQFHSQLSRFYSPEMTHVYRHAPEPFLPLIDDAVKHLWSAYPERHFTPEPEFLPFPLEPRRWPADRVVEVAFSRLTGGNTRAILCPPTDQPDHFTRRYNRWARSHLVLLDLARYFVQGRGIRSQRSAADRQAVALLLANVNAFRTRMVTTQGAASRFGGQRFTGSQSSTLEAYFYTVGLVPTTALAWRRFAGDWGLAVTRAGYPSRSMSEIASTLFSWSVITLRGPLPPNLQHVFPPASPTEMLCALVIRATLAAYRLIQACVAAIEEMGTFTPVQAGNAYGLLDCYFDWMHRLEQDGMGRLDTNQFAVHILTESHLTNLAALEVLLHNLTEQIAHNTTTTRDPWVSDHEPYTYHSIGEDGCWYPARDEDDPDEEHDGDHDDEGGDD